MRAESSGNLTATGTTIRTSGDAAFGAVASAATVALSNGSVTTSGIGATGVRAEGGGNLTAMGTTILTSGANGLGAVASGAAVALNSGSVTTSGLGATGVRAESSGNLTATGTSIRTLGDNALGAAASGATVALNNGSVTTSGIGATGVRAESSGNLTATGTTILTSGANALGAVASAAAVVLNSGSVTTSGASAHGLSAQDGASLTASNVATQVSGNGAAAVHIAGGTSAAPNLLTVTGGTLASSQGPVVLAEGGTGTISLNGPIAISSGLVGGRLALATVTSGAAPSNLTLNLTNLGGVAGIFSVTGANNVVNATFNATNWTGDLVADPGNTAHINLLGSAWTGQATHAGDVRVDGASAWTVTGSSDATGTVANAGLIQFAPLASGFSSLTTGSYVGQGGRMVFNTVLGSDNSPTNLLVVKGGTATGTTTLSVTNAGGGGALTLADGIRLVQATNGATTQPGAFNLAGRVTAGAYEYRLFRGGSSGAEDWFLRSNLVQGPPSPPIGPADPAPPSPPVIPLYRPEVGLYAPIPAMARHMGLATLGTLHERVGEEMNIVQNPESRRYANGTWMRLIGERGSSRWSGTVDSRVNDANLVGIQAGFDVYRSQHDNGHRDHVGLYVAYTDYRSSNVSGFALGQQNLRLGRLTLNGPAVGAYWTHFGPSGWYLDAVVQGNWFDAKATSLYEARMSTSGSGFAASLEGGYPLRLSQRWQLEPQAQIIYQSVSVNRSRDAYSTIGWNEDDAVTGRIGGRLQYTARDANTLWQPYAKANLWHGFGGTDRASFGASPAVENRFGNTSVELGVGVTARITQTASLYGHIDHRWSVDGRERRSTTQGVVAVRFNW